jgi:hypothetical protein
MIKAIAEKVMREEYGGCNPLVDEVCQLKARVHRVAGVMRRIEVFVVGKWRGIRYYGGTLDAPKSKKILDEIERTVRINTGSHLNHRGFDPTKGTFAGKKIVFVWQEPINEV